MCIFWKHLCHLGILFHSNSGPFPNSLSLCPFPLLTACNARSTIRWSPSSLRFSPSPCARHSSFHRGTRINLPDSGCRDCCNLVVEDVLQCNEKFTVRSRRSSQSEVEQALKQPFLDCEHLFLISDCAEPVLELVSLADERPQDVVKLLHVLGPMSFTDVADWCCIC